MSNFAARLDLTNYAPLETFGYFQITGNIIDNMSFWSVYDVNINDIIYINTSMNGGPLVVKYIITEIINIDNPPEIILNINQIDPNPEIYPLDPWGSEAMIGKPSSIGILDILDWSVQYVTVSFITAIQNFQQNIINIKLNEIVFPSSNRIFNDHFIGDINGINNSFITSQSIKENSEHIYVNGNLQKNIEDYYINENNNIVFNFNLEENTNLIIDYDPI